MVEGRVISIKEIDTLATMPSKEEIYSKLLFLINSPAQRLVTVIGATGRDLAIVVNQGVKENKFKGGEEAPALVARAAKKQLLPSRVRGIARSHNKFVYQESGVATARGLRLSGRDLKLLGALETLATDNTNSKLITKRWRKKWRTCSN